LEASIEAISSIDQKERMPNAQETFISLFRSIELESLEKRERIHRFWWDKLGSEGHISLPMLKKEIINEFGYKDNRSILTKIK